MDYSTSSAYTRQLARQLYTSLDSYFNRVVKPEYKNLSGKEVEELRVRFKRELIQDHLRELLEAIKYKSLDTLLNNILNNTE